MADYEDLPALKGKLKLAAIDAWMKDEHFEIDGDDRYYDTRSATDFEMWVSRPGADGEGGGDWGCSGFGPDSWYNGGNLDGYYSGSFEEIRARVDDALRPWEDLPDPGDFEPYIEHLRRANVDLSGAPSTSGGATNGAGGIGANLTIIQENSTEMAGGIITNFKSMFLLALGNSVGGLQGLTVVLGTTLAGEKALWRKARTDLATTVDTATKAFDAYARDSSHDWQLSFGVADAVLTGVTAFATGGATAALSGAGAVLKLLSAVEGESDRQAEAPEGGSYEALMAGFGQSLANLNDLIAAEEQHIQDNLTQNIGHVTTDPGFDLAPPLPGVDDDSDLHLPGEAAIFLNPTLVREITGTAMPRIADELVEGRKNVWRSNKSTPWVRDAAIGLGGTGPYHTWSDLSWVAWNLLADLNWEVRNGAKTLELAMEDMGRVDSDAQDALEVHAAAIAGGSGYTPYDHLDD